MKVSNCTVVIPTYNNGFKIKRAVESVLLQTVLPTAIIIIDDCSKDEKHLAVLEELNEHNLIETIYLKENSGPGSARNLGIKKADTKFIAFLDADDSWHPQKLEIQLKIMERDNYFLTAHDTVLKDDDNSSESFEMNYLPPAATIKKLKLFKGNIISTRSVMMRNTKEFYFVNNKRYSEDFLMWLEVVLKHKKMGFINLKLGYVHKEDYDEGLSSNMERMLFGELENFEILYKKNLINKIEKNLLSIYYSFKYFIRLSKKYKKINEKMDYSDETDV